MTILRGGRLLPCFPFIIPPRLGPKELRFFLPFPEPAFTSPPSSLHFLHKESLGRAHRSLLHLQGRPFVKVAVFLLSSRLSRSVLSTSLLKWILFYFRTSLQICPHAGFRQKRYVYEWLFPTFTLNTGLTKEALPFQDLP